ncbi:factor associated with metabolism and energy [Tamandua tetradactyla]|uniref:factor associated with metabolism and energy n=1 Tax=Tamandua tetradactyla TaxID=48850 RepID=UPI0040545265
MGLNHSKAHPRVTKVAPLENKEGEASPASPVDFASRQNLEEKSLFSLARLQDQNKALAGQLPPLRETWYGRYSAVPRAMYFDLLREQGETSIIKRHPPRRLQKLEPTDLPQVITSGSLLSQQQAERTHKTKQELEKKMQDPTCTSGKRQYLHKMQMLEMNRKRQEAMELKKSLHREARMNRQKLREHKTKEILQSVPRNDDHGLLTLLPNETLNKGPGNSRDSEFFENQAGNDYCPWKHGKMETWLREQEAQSQLLWDSSNSDSEEWGRDEKKPRALVRTRTERITLFDEFFDQE